MASAESAYNTFRALKIHFQSSTYDYFKYNKKVKQASPKNRFLFEKLAKRKDLEGLIVSNLITRKIGWAGDFLTDEAQKIYEDWLRRKESLTYIFSKDLELLSDKFITNIKVSQNEFPKLIKLFQRKEICIETFVILNSIFGLFSLWDKKIVDNVIYDDLKLLILKYTPFVEFDKKKIKDLIKARFMNE